MSGEKYPAKLIEKVARAIQDADTADRCYGIDGDCSNFDGKCICRDMAIASLGAIPYAAMREALEAVMRQAPTADWHHLYKIAHAALRAADGEET